MRGKKITLLLLALIVCSMNAWSYRITDNYTIEVKFKINAIGAGIAFAGYEGFGGNIAMWQYNVGIGGDQSKFRPHDWRVGGVLLEEKGTGDVTLNTSDWFVTTIEVSNNGNHVDTYLRRADDDTDVLIDSRDSRFAGEFRYGLVGAREDHDGNTNESATFDYIKVTANETGENLYYEDFDASNGSWLGDPIWNEAEGTLTVEGRNLSEVRYFPGNMFLDAVDMHYTVEADVAIESGYVSLIFGLDESNGGSNYMWQISPNFRNDNGVCNYYHLDNGGESWKAHAAGPNYPDFGYEDFWDLTHHVMIEVKSNVVYTYIDGKLEDTFTQCDMTDLALLNPGKMGIRVDAGNGLWHSVYIDNVKLTEYDSEGNPNVVMEDGFDGGAAHYFELTGKNATYASVVEKDGNYVLHINCDGTEDLNAKVRLIQTDDFVCTHNYENGICTVCGKFEEPAYSTELSAYTIGNLGQLIRFSQIVNGGEQGANGFLTADIDMENSELFQPIGLNNDGSWQKPFMGTFYGNNHVIRNLFVKTECEGGLFSRTRGGKIYNLGLENAHIESTAGLRCGAIAGEHHDNAIMQNCYAIGNIEFVTAHAQKDAVAGECAGGHFVNCYTTLPKMSCDYPMGGDMTNSYEGVTAEQAASGEIAYKLGDAFGQYIGTDAYPVLDGAEVYYVGECGYATMYDATTGYVLNGAQAHVATLVGETWLKLTEIDNVPAGTPVVLKGSYYNMLPEDLPAINIANDLKGTDAETSADGTMYVLAKPEGEEVGFYLAEGTIPAGKAYYQGKAGVKAFYFAGEGTTGLSELNNWTIEQSDNCGIYNLSGQRVSKMQKGINIVGGKKILK